MVDEFIKSVISSFQSIGYNTTSQPTIPGVKALLYAQAKQARRIAAAKFINHYLFVDWDNDLFGRLEVLKETHKKFSKYVNKAFHVAHAWRMTLPNLAVVAVSLNPFSTDVVNYVKNTYMNPWYGGETGQFMLFTVQTHELICHIPPRFKEQGSIPLLYAVDEISAVIAATR